VRSESGDTSRQITKSSRILNSSSSTYELQDTPSTGQTQTDPKFVHFGMHNYAQTLDLAALAGLPLNPVNLVAGAVQYSGGFKPIYMVNSFHDKPSAYHQLVTMVCLLQSNGLTRGTDFDYLTIPGSDGHLHSFQYWDTWDHVDPNHQITVGDDVIGFLMLHAFGVP
jgi:hypothetical protein